MKKRQIFALFCVFFYSLGVYASYEDIQIISRSEWGADETLRYLSSPDWQNILKKREEQALIPLTAAQKQKQAQEQEKSKKISDYLLSNYPEELKVNEKITKQDGETLAWPITKTQQVKAIVVHHTDTNYATSLDSIRAIYKYHAISRGWGDIGYNFLIGKDGEIYEGRAGGDYTTAAHALYNNYSTIGIAMIGEYDTDPINEKQYTSLKNLVAYLAKKYGINMGKKLDFHKECLAKDCKNPLLVVHDYPLVGHRDVGYTTCPGGKLYEQIHKIREELAEQTAGFTPIENSNTGSSKIYIPNKVTASLVEKLKGKSYTDVVELAASVEEGLNNNISKQTSSLSALKKAIFQYLDTLQEPFEQTVEKTYDDVHNIKIKLSYPGTGGIDIEDGKRVYNFKVEGDMLTILGKKFKNITLTPKYKKYLTISSWERIPAWDTQKKYNDNMFRGTLTLQVKNGQIEVVNTLSVTEYLKGLAEVSNTDDTEKIKTIIIAARTYARYYMGSVRKFPNTNYDGSDNPDEFQKYLGYGFELRSPNISKIVDQTKDQVIVYKDILIKPWYFHSSDGVTKSFYEYCVGKGNSQNYCKAQAKLYPYLTARKDIGSAGKSFDGHGVGISGNGASFFAKKGWSAPMIINYYLKGTQVKKKSN